MSMQNNKKNRKIKVLLLPSKKFSKSQKHIRAFLFHFKKKDMHYYKYMYNRKRRIISLSHIIDDLEANAIPKDIETVGRILSNRKHFKALLSVGREIISKRERAVNSLKEKYIRLSESQFSLLDKLYLEFCQEILIPGISLDDVCDCILALNVPPEPVLKQTTARLTSTSINKVDSIIKYYSKHHSENYSRCEVIRQALDNFWKQNHETRVSNLNSAFKYYTIKHDIPVLLYEYDVDNKFTLRNQIEIDFIKQIKENKKGQMKEISKFLLKQHQTAKNKKLTMSLTKSLIIEAAIFSFMSKKFKFDL